MQNNMQTTADQQSYNNWYSNMFAANVKTEPGVQEDSPAPSATAACSTHLENYLKQRQHHHHQQQQQQFTQMDAPHMTASPTKNQNDSRSNCEQQLFDANSMHQQLMQQHKYQQQFQHAQQAAAQNQVTSQMFFGFNPLTPPGLPQAVLPAIPHFYKHSAQHQPCNPEQTPINQTLLENSAEKSTLTPSNTPPMDITPPKSPKAHNPSITYENQQDQELMSNASEYIVESDEEENTRQRNYNSHGKMRQYKCKSCGRVNYTKLEFWEHVKEHMKPEKILQCHYANCLFVTELKHHLEYHILKHKNEKPFKCDKCPYSCVNKSMLNSHRKSHSSIYPYRCNDCDYATKYCHSFKLHLRKRSHKPGVVLDEEGLPNPSVVIDVYGTRRGPKNKGSAGASMKKSSTNLKIAHPQLSAASQSFTQNQNQLHVSADSSSTSVASDLPALTVNMSLQQQQQTQSANTLLSPSQQSSSQAVTQSGSVPNMLPSLASLLQQNTNMAFLPYWNLHVFAQQQAAVLAQLSPRIREQLKKYQINKDQLPEAMDKSDDEDGGEQVEEGDQDCDTKSANSVMDLSHGTPTKDDEEKQTPELAMNLKVPEENAETPLYSTITSNRRKGRVLKLDQFKTDEDISAPTSPQMDDKTEISNATSSKATAKKIDDSCSADECMETEANLTNNNPSNTSNTSTASSSGNSSNSSSTASNSNNSTANSSASVTPTMFECKYCDIFFKDDVIYTIHMGYHSCDDVFRCNMCGEKCDGPVGLFVHMARFAHS